MIVGEEWKEEEGKVALDFPMASRYAQAGTVFLFQVSHAGPNILAGTVRKVSPNGQYALIGPENGPEGAWLPCKSITVLDVLVPMREKQPKQKPLGQEELMNALIGFTTEIVVPKKKIKIRKGKQTNE